MRWSRGLGLILSVVMCCAMRAGAGELIADLLAAEQIRKAAQAGTAGWFVEAVGAGREQQEAAETIVSGARAAVQREVNRHLRQIRTGVDNVEAGYASEAQMVKAVRAIEQNMLEDLRALTNDSQAAGIARFEQEGRRIALLGTYGRGPCPMDLRAEPKRLKVDVLALTSDGKVPETPAELLGAAAAQSETELDIALVAVGKAERAYLRSVRERDSAAQETTRREANAAGARLSIAQVLAWRRITSREDVDSGRWVRYTHPSLGALRSDACLRGSLALYS